MLRGIENTRIFVRLTEEEKEALESMRKEYSATMSRFVREKIIVPFISEHTSNQKKGKR